MLESLNNELLLKDLILDSPTRGSLPFEARRDIPPSLIRPFSEQLIVDLNNAAIGEEYNRVLKNITNFTILFPEQAHQTMHSKDIYTTQIISLFQFFASLRVIDEDARKRKALYLLPFAISFYETFYFLLTESVHVQHIERYEHQMASQQNYLNYSHILVTKKLLFPNSFKIKQRDINRWQKISGNFKQNLPNLLLLQSNLKILYPEYAPFGLTTYALYDKISEEVSSWKTIEQSSSELFDRAAVCKLLLSENITMTENGLKYNPSLPLKSLANDPNSVPVRRKF